MWVCVCVQIGEQERENKRLQEENERLRAEVLAAKAADKAAKLVEDMHDALCCPISMALFDTRTLGTQLRPRWCG